MGMGADKEAGQHVYCPVAATMNLLNQKWTLHIIHTLTKNGEVFEIENADEVFHQQNKWARLRKIWFDTVEVPYWEKVKINHSVNGSQVGQTFLNSQDGWLTQIELGFAGVVGPMADENQPERVGAFGRLLIDRGLKARPVIGLRIGR